MARSIQSHSGDAACRLAGKRCSRDRAHNASSPDASRVAADGGVCRRLMGERWDPWTPKSNTNALAVIELASGVPEGLVAFGGGIGAAGAEIRQRAVGQTKQLTALTRAILPVDQRDQR